MPRNLMPGEVSADAEGGSLGRYIADPLLGTSRYHLLSDSMQQSRAWSSYQNTQAFPLYLLTSFLTYSNMSIPVSCSCLFM